MSVHFKIVALDHENLRGPFYDLSARMTQPRNHELRSGCLSVEVAVGVALLDESPAPGTIAGVVVVVGCDILR